MSEITPLVGTSRGAKIFRTLRQNRLPVEPRGGFGSVTGEPIKGAFGDRWVQARHPTDGLLFLASKQLRDSRDETGEKSGLVK